MRPDEQDLRCRVAFFYPNLQSGGTERVVHTLIPHLEEVFNLSVLNLLHDNRLSSNTRTKQITISWSNNIVIARYMRALHELYRLRQKDKIEVICAFGEVPIVLTSALKILCPDLKIVSCIRNSEQNHFRQKNFIIRRIKMLVFKLSLLVANEVSVNAQALRHEINSLIGGKKHIHVLKNPVSEMFFNIANPFPDGVASIRLLNIGRLVPQKNHEELIYIFKRLQKSISNTVTLTIVGDGPDVTKLRRLSDGTEGLKLLSFVDEPDQLYRSHDIFCLTSKWEGSPNVLLESMAAGMPVIAYDCPTGPGEVIVDGSNGRLVNLDNTEQYLEALITMIEDLSVSRAMGMHAIKSMQCRRVETISKEWIKLIKNV
jgi:glycosyltransferase involved in cell wall biosynthesis